MDSAASFEAKLQEHLQAVQAAAVAAKERVADGIAGVRPPEAVPARAAADQPPPAWSRATVSFEDVASFDAPPTMPEPTLGGGELDAEGIPVWEDPP